MDNLSRNEMKLRQEAAEKELKKMWEKSTLPPFPPFVQTSQQDHRNNTPPDAAGPVFTDPPKKRGLTGLLGKDIFKFLDLKNFELDSDRMLILLMIVLLSGEDSDNILLFALAYIML